MNKDKFKLLICAMICITLIICSILFWPTLYRYDKIESSLIKVNRLTGYTEILSTIRHKWYEAPKFRPEDYSIIPPLPDNEKSKIVREKPFDDLLVKGPLPEGSYVDTPNKDDLLLKSYLYNGSNLTINKMIVVIDAKNKNGTTRWKRKYKAKIIGEFIGPFSSGSIIVEPSDANGVAAYIWFIDEAYGYKNE